MSFFSSSVLSKDDTPPTVDLNSIKNHTITEKNVTKKSHGSMDILPQKAVVLQMQDFNKLENKVANALIKAIPKCDVSTIKIFELLVSAIDPFDPPSDQIVYIEKELFYEFLNLNGTKRAVNLKNKVKRFCEQLLFDFSSLSDSEREAINEIIARDEPNLVPLHKEHIVTAATEIFWEPRKPSIAFEMTRRILFFLSHLGENKEYTTYDLVGMSKFESKYSVVLYRWLRMKYQIFNWNLKENNAKNKIEISMKELRELTDTVEAYKRMDHFEERVLQVPQKEINEFSTIQFDYRKIKKGRNVVAIQFFVSDNPKNKPVKSDRLTPKKSKEEREADLLASAYKAIVNDYTDMLSERMFLKKGYKKDKKLLARLNDDLYPLYDSVVSEKGEEMLEIHLDMIQRRVEQAKSDVNDVVAYLLTCIKQSKDKNYLDEFKYQKNKHSYS